MHSIQRKSHFLGTKIKSLRKRNNLTLEDLSIRCIQMNPESAPSISYLSMIENGELDPQRMGSGIQYGDSSLRKLTNNPRTKDQNGCAC